MAKWKLSELFWRTEIVPIEENEPAVESAVQPSSGLGAVLATLRDVQGVVGSIAIGPDGALWCRDLPPLFDEDSTGRLAARLAQLHEALTAEGDQLDAAALRYQGYRLHVSRAVPGLLGVLSQEHVNLPALSMAMKLVARKLSTYASGGGGQ